MSIEDIQRLERELVEKAQNNISGDIVKSCLKIVKNSNYGTFCAPFRAFRPKPSPSEKEQQSELFNAIWDCIKTWDIKIPEYEDGYMGANGSHVKIIMDAIAPAVRDAKIDNILKEEE
jgi:hypothetical protein